MKVATLLAALVTVSLLAGCKARTSQTQTPTTAAAAQSPNPAKVDLAAMAATTDQLAKDNAELRKTLAALAQREQDRNALSAQLDQATKTAADLQAANTRLNSALTESEAKLQQAVEAFKLAGDKAQAARMDLLEAQQRALAKQNAELADKLANLHDDRDMVQARVLAKLQQQADDAQDAMQALQAQNDDVLNWLQELQQSRSDGAGIFVAGPAAPWWLWLRHHGAQHGPVHPIAHGKESGGSHEQIGGSQINSGPAPVPGGGTEHGHGISTQNRTYNSSTAFGNSGGRSSNPVVGSNHTQGSAGQSSPPWSSSVGNPVPNSNAGGGFSAGPGRGSKGP